MFDMDLKFDTHRVLTIAIAYNNEEETKKFLSCLSSLPSYKGQALIIVNNGTPMHELTAHAFMSASLCQIRVVDTKQNLGYFGGARWIFAQYLKENDLPEWVVIANTDIEFPDPQFFSKLETYHQVDTPGLVAPDIVLDAGTSLPSTFVHQNPYFIERPSQAYFLGLYWINRFYLIYLGYEVLSAIRHRCRNWLWRGSAQKAIGKGPMRIYAPFGACLIFNKKYFLAGGNLDYPPFLFGEEIFVAETMRHLGFSVVFDPRLTIIHREHASLRTTGSRTRWWHTKESISYLKKTYFSI